MATKKEGLEVLNVAANRMLLEFEIFSLKKDLDPELKKECISLMKNEISRRKSEIILYPYIKTIMDEINNFLKVQ